MPLLRNGAIDHSTWTNHVSGSEAKAHQMVPLSEYLQNADAWQQLEGPWLLVVQPEDNLDDFPSTLLDQAQLGIAFPVFTDGRGYSHARQLRDYHGYQGELIATGDVRRDQIDFMARVGIDSFECSADIDVADWCKALHELHAAVTA